MESDPENLDNLSSDDDFEFDVDEQKVWLVKVPNFLYQNWIQQPANQHLGKLVIKPNEISLQLDDVSLPSEYKCQITNYKPESMFSFTENSMGNACGIVGKVEHEAVLNPVVNDKYRALIRERNQQDVVDRTVKILDRKQTRQGMALATQSTKWDTHNTKKIVLDKRERMPREELIDLIFEQFEAKEHWSLKDLGLKTMQPLQYLKEVLSEMCIQNKRGPYAGMYELNSDYKVGDPSAVGTPTEYNS